MTARLSAGGTRSPNRLLWDDADAVILLKLGKGCAFVLGFFN